MNKELIKRCDFEKVVNDWFSRGWWHQPVGIVAKLRHLISISPAAFYYNVDECVNYQKIIEEDFNAVLIKDGVILTIDVETSLVFPGHINITHLNNFVKYHYKADMQMIMDTQIDPALYSTLLI